MTVDTRTLGEEREFLLRSLRDLEAEHDAGDIDESDYEELKRDYTARAAAVIRAMQEPAGTRAAAAVKAAAAPRRSWRVPIAVGMVVLLAVLAGWAVASSSGDRTAGQNITGSAPGAQSSSAAAAAAGTSVQDLLSQARGKFGQQDILGAVKLYDQVLKQDPKQPEALAYKGWLLHLAGLDSQALESLNKAVEADASYPDAHFFRGEVLCTFSHDQAGAVSEYQRFLSSNPPAQFATLVETRLKSAQTGACAGGTADFGPPPPGAATPTTAKP
jgi:tetratricopeptide (TPR) repeat protein